MARLPKVNFQPVVNPYVALPTQELGLATQVLRKDYEDALAQTNQARQALGTVQAYDPRDQEMLDAANEELLNTINAVQESGDYERQKSLIGREFGKYQGLVQPIMQKNQQIQQVGEYANKMGADRGRVINAWLSDPNNQIVNENGIYYNRARPESANRFIAPNINLTEELNKAAKNINVEASQWADEGKIKSSDQMGGRYTMKIQTKGGEKWIDPNEVQSLLRSRLGDSDIQRYINAEKELLKAEGLTEEEADRQIQQMIEERIGRTDAQGNAIGGSVTQAAAFTNTLLDKNVQVIGETFDDTAKSKIDPLIYNVANGEMFQAVDSNLASVGKRLNELGSLVESGEATPEQRAEYSQLKTVQDKAFSEIEQQVDIDKFYQQYNELASKNDQAVSKDQFVQMLRNPETFNFENNNWLVRNLSSIDDDNPPTATVSLRNSFNKMWDVIRDQEEKIKIAKSPMIITALSEGKYSNLIGGVNENLSETFRKNVSGYNLLLSGESLGNTDFLKEKYGAKDEEVSIGNKDFDKGRDPSKDTISISGNTYQGKPIFQLTIRNEDGEILGSELISGRQEDGLRQIEQVASTIYNHNPELGIEILSNIRILPQIQSKPIFTNRGVTEYESIKLVNPQTGEVDEIEGLKVQPIKNENGSIGGIELLNDNNQPIAQFNSQEELSYNLYKNYLASLRNE